VPIFLVGGLRCQWPRGPHVRSLPVELEFDLGGLAKLAVLDADERVRRYVMSEMDPYPAGGVPEGDPCVVIEADTTRNELQLLDVQNPAQDATVTGADTDGFYVLCGGRACRLPDRIGDSRTAFHYQHGFPIWRIFGSVVRPALQISLLSRRVVALHSAAVEIESGGLVIAGWSESGKTETALAFAEGGARFLSDKWTMLTPDGAIAAFPTSVGVRRWVLQYLPRLRSALPWRARAQLAAAGIAGAASRPLLARPARGRVAGLAVEAVERATALGDRAALRLSEVRAAYGDTKASTWSAPLCGVALLTTVSGGTVKARAADAAWAVRRLARSAAYERRTLFELYERAGFAFPDRELKLRGATVAEEERLLAERLASIPVIAVEAPFPVDPRRIADAIARSL